jgi:POT family proton-dependent oligopeptide transporter
MMMGVNTLAVFLASTIGGRIGGLYEVLPPSTFWLIHAAISAAGAVIFLLLRPVVRRVLMAAG